MVITDEVKRMRSSVKKVEYDWKGSLLAMFAQAFLLIFFVAVMKVV